MTGPLPLRLDSPARAPARAPAPRDDATEDTGGGGRLLCGGCGNPITHPRHRIERGGAHEHGRINPAGFSFHLGCFAAAPGVALLGPPSTEHTWFPGYAWRIALCGACRDQLGWRFQDGGGDVFFGLILGRLVPEDGPEV